MSMDCYHPIGGKYVAGGDGGGRSCNICGQSGHLSMDCHQRVGGKYGSGSRSCHICRDPGHLARDCNHRFDRKVSGGGGRAGGSSSYTRSESGNFSRGGYWRAVSKFGSGGGRGGRSCYSCGEFGHLARDCTPRAGSGRGGRRSCYNCGELGHLARDCHRRVGWQRSACGCGAIHGESDHLTGDCQHRVGWNHLVGGSWDCNGETRSPSSRGLIVVNIPYSSSNEGDKEDTLYNANGGATLIENSLSCSNEANIEETLSNGRPTLIENSSSSSNEVNKNATLYNFASIMIENPPSSSNEGNKDATLSSEAPIVTAVPSSSSNEGDKEGAFSNGSPDVIEISSSSSSEGEEEEEEEEEEVDFKIRNGFSNVKVKTEGKSWVEDVDGDCCILDFDPFQPPTIDFKQKLSLSDKHLSTIQDDDISIIAERGQVACRDYPHSRHLCANYPFNETSHVSCCPQCYCYVCDVVAPCSFWDGSPGLGLGHCDASDHEHRWKFLRELIRKW